MPSDPLLIPTSPSPRCAHARRHARSPPAHCHRPLLQRTMSSVGLMLGSPTSTMRRAGSMLFRDDFGIGLATGWLHPNGAAAGRCGAGGMTRMRRARRGTPLHHRDKNRGVRPQRSSQRAASDTLHAWHLAPPAAAWAATRSAASWARQPRCPSLPMRPRPPSCQCSRGERRAGLAWEAECWCGPCSGLRLRLHAAAFLPPGVVTALAPSHAHVPHGPPMAPSPSPCPSPPPPPHTHTPHPPTHTHQVLRHLCRPAEDGAGPGDQRARVPGAVRPARHAGARRRGSVEGVVVIASGIFCVPCCKFSPSGDAASPRFPAPNPPCHHTPARRQPTPRTPWDPTPLRLAATASRLSTWRGVTSCGGTLWQTPATAGTPTYA